MERQSEFILETHSSCLVPRTSSSQRWGSSIDVVAAAAAVVEAGGDIFIF